MTPVWSYVLSKWQTLSTSDHASVVSINLFVALLCACIVIGHLLEETRWMNESITALFIGMFTGVIILLVSGGKSSHLLLFSEDIFFIYLLPPIIFNAGFQVKKKQFFVNFITIICLVQLLVFSYFSLELMLTATLKPYDAQCAPETLQISPNIKLERRAFQIFQRMDVGTLDIADILAIGAIFAATDSVCTLQILNQDETPLLYSLVFGEGDVVNDATSVVLFNAIQSLDLSKVDARVALHFIGSFFYLFSTSTLLGSVACFCYLILHFSETLFFVYVGMDALDIEKWSYVSDSGSKKIILGNRYSELHLTSEWILDSPIFLVQAVFRAKSLRLLRILFIAKGRKFDDAFMRSMFGGTGRLVPFVPGIANRKG
ncbi:Sodium/hydrogen exchanger 2, partial [Cucurbita argyrosperma subsp. sororia]